MLQQLISAHSSTSIRNYHLRHFALGALFEEESVKEQAFKNTIERCLEEALKPEYPGCRILAVDLGKAGDLYVKAGIEWGGLSRIVDIPVEVIDRVFEESTEVQDIHFKDCDDMVVVCNEGVA